MARLQFLALLLVSLTLQAQVRRFPFFESFDSVTSPALPSGWTASAARSPGGDFTTVSSSALSPPNAVVSTNATIPQYLVSPSLDFSNRHADSIIFHERRTSSHNSGVLVEASTDGGLTFSIQIGDTLVNSGTSSYVERSFKLPSSIDDHPSVILRWRVVGNGTGRTGTIRLDDINITALAAFDVGVSSIRFSPQYPVVGDSVSIFARIRNFGIQTATNVPVGYYVDADGDSLPEPAELISMAYIPALGPGDSSDTEWTIPHLHGPALTIIVRTDLPDDQNSLNDLAIAILSAGRPQGSIVINEIMYAPIIEPEWVEFFNNTQSDIDLRNWKLSNRSSSSKYAITESTAIFPSNGFAVVTKDTAIFASVHVGIPSLLIQATALPTYMFNNGGDAVVLYDSRGAVMDSVRYAPTWGGTSGKSLERIEPTGPSIDSTNWASSNDLSWSTPGRANSVTPLDYDLRVLRISSSGLNQSTFQSNVVVQNVGRHPAQNFSVSLYADSVRDSIPGRARLLGGQFSSSSLLPKDSMLFQFGWENPSSGTTYLLAQIEYAQDLRMGNNIGVDSVKKSFPLNSVIVNEIMYQPISGEAEYIELYNRGPVSCDLDGWTISDMRDKSGRSTVTPIAHSAVMLNPGSYFVVASDSSIFSQFPSLRAAGQEAVVSKSGLSLNDGGDDVILRDLTGAVIDSVRYTPLWQNPNVADATGRSLERVNPGLPSNDSRNWSTCAARAGGTPGERNSIFTSSLPTSARLNCSPNPFSPDGDGHEDFTIISYELPTSAALVRIRIFDARGRLIRTLANGEPSGAHGQVVWDGLTDRREKARIGIYIVLLEALDASGGSMQATKCTVVVAARL